MLGGVVKHNRLIEMRSPFRDIPGLHQGNAYEAKPDHERDCRSLLLRERQELDRKLALGRLSKRFSLFDQQTWPVRGGLGFRRGEPFDMEEWGYERDLRQGSWSN